MSRTIYFLFSYYLDKNRYNFPAKEKILRQNIKKESKCDLWFLNAFSSYKYQRNQQQLVIS
jgi:hypothetical protein